MSNAETLRWLNHRLGQQIHVEIVFTTPDRAHDIFGEFVGDGILRHSSGDYYEVGEKMSFKTTGFDAAIGRRSDWELVIEIADSVLLRLIDPSRPMPKLWAPIRFGGRIHGGGDTRTNGRTVDAQDQEELPNE